MATIAKIGAAIRSARNAKRLSALELAEKAGVHPNTLLKLERGNGNIELSGLLALISTLELDLLLIPKKVAAMRAADEEKTTITEMGARIKGLMPK